MKQLLQSLKSGETSLVEIPVSVASGNNVLIKASRSLISLGTEKMLVSFGKAGYLEKARQQPEKVKQVLDKVRSDGLRPTIAAVKNKLDQPIPLGYSNVGVIQQVGREVIDFKKGDRVVSNGPHAEYVTVPNNLVVKIPDKVTDEEATFTVLGAIALQGIRLANPTFGEIFVVQGLGLIGLLACQLLKANGCKVIGIDPEITKCELASKFGINAIHLKKDSPVQQVLNLTNQFGVDGVIITASSNSDAIVSQAAQMSRKRGRIVLIGVVGLKLNRAEFYERELSFQVSCSYGPGRYDENYESKGIDYPLPYVRWTEKRNFDAVLEAIKNGSLNVKPLITNRIKFENVQGIYEDLDNPNSIATIIEYKENADPSEIQDVIKVNQVRISDADGVIGLIGAGNFTKMAMLPALKKANANIKYIASSGGVSGTHLAKKYKIEYSTTDYYKVLSDDDVKMVFITTHHHQHAPMVIDALKAGKHVFVEKPLAINLEQLSSVNKMLSKCKDLTITIGFNRRFSKHTQKIKSLIGNNSGSLNMIATINAGYISQDSWIQDMERGGGRIIGEACHFIDLMVYISGSKVKAVCMNALGSDNNSNTNNASLLLQFENGSNGVINYFSNGHKAYSKERIEIYTNRKTLVLDNFRILRGYGFKGFSKLSTKQDKGHQHQFNLLTILVKEGGDPLIPYDEIYNVSKASILAVESLKSGGWLRL